MNLPLNIVKFLQPGYLFDLQPAISAEALFMLAAVFGLCLILGVIAAVIARRPHEHTVQVLYGRYSALLLTLGVIGYILLWFRYEGAYFMSARFWLVLWAAGLIAWLIPTLVYQRREIPRARQQRAAREQMQRYLPGRK